MPILCVEGRGAVINVYESLLHRQMPDLHIKKLVDGPIVRFPGMARLWKVGRPIQINDDVKDRARNIQFCQSYARAPQSQQAHPRPQVIELSERRFTLQLPSVNHQAVCLCFEPQQLPMERCNLNLAACCLFYFGYPAVTHHAYKPCSAYQKINSSCNQNQQHQNGPDGQRNMAQKEATQSFPRAQICLLY